MELSSSYVDLYPPLVLSSISSFPHDGYDSDLFDHIAPFHGYDDSPRLHIVFFMRVVVDFNIVHEDDLMRIFASHLEDEASYWFQDPGRKSISSIADFIECSSSNGIIKEEGKNWEVIEDVVTALHKRTYQEAIEDNHVEDLEREEALEDALKEAHIDDLVDESIDAPISSLNDDEGLMSFTLYQNFEDKTFEDDRFENDFASTFEDRGSQGCDVMDVHFPIFYHSLGDDCRTFVGDRNYNASYDGSVDFEALGQPILEEISHDHFHAMYMYL